MSIDMGIGFLIGISLCMLLSVDYWFFLFDWWKKLKVFYAEVKSHEELYSYKRRVKGAFYEAKRQHDISILEKFFEENK